MNNEHQLNIDYSALDYDVTWSEYFKSSYADFKISIWTMLGRILYISLLLGMAFIYCVIVLSLVTMITNSIAQLFALIGGIIVLMIIWYLILYFSKKYRRDVFRAQLFAKNNNLTQLTLVRDPQYPGTIFTQGHSRYIEHGYIFPQFQSLEMGNYTYTTGSGKSSTDHTYGYMKIQLPRKLPHMLLDAKANNFMRRMSNIPGGFSNNQIIELEGDFNNYFTLYAPKSYERDALYIFTPDVMQALVTHFQDFDVEIIDDTMFIYTSTKIQLTNKEELQNLLAISMLLTKELVDQSHYYADEKVGNRKANMVAYEGRRLHRNNFVLPLGGCMVLIYFAYAIFRDFSINFADILFIVLIISVIWIVFKPFSKK